MDHTEARIREVEDVIHARARKAGSSGACYDDLVQEGRIAAWRALDKWSPDGGSSWRTYAGWAIRNAVARAAWDQGQPVGPRFTTVVNRRSQSGKLTDRVGLVGFDTPEAMSLAAPVGDEPATPARLWCATAALRHTRAAHALVYLLYHRCGQTIYQIGEGLGFSHETARKYEQFARRDVEARAADFELRATPEACATWGRSKGPHLAPIPSLGLCPHCWARLNAATRSGRD